MLDDINHDYIDRDTHPEGGLDAINEIDNCDVVRAEFLSPMFRPKITLNNDRLAFSASCVRLMPDVEYVQMLFDRNKRRIIILPCGRFDKDALQWSTCKNGKAQPKGITARLLCFKLFDFMEWRSESRYKSMAVYQILDGKQLIVFNLHEVEMVISEEVASDDGKVKRKLHRVYPMDWRNSFGTLYCEHKATYEVNLDDYYIMTRKDGESGSTMPRISGAVPTASDIITRQYYTPDKPMDKPEGVTRDA
ncbi:hypothetical protein AGMMS49992_31400 [Clostridia bacterium]|nr:hypothetical protein AGMMS49992_31400 [Clostridia bacterium]